MKEKIVVVCPGRGSYTKETLGYFRKHVAAPKAKDFIQELDNLRKDLKQPSLSELDSAATFQVNLHTKGEHASPLIYACSALDFMAIDRDRFEIVAVTGNSMGWYITLGLGGALDNKGAFEVINTMGSMMKDEIIGGQVIYPVVDAQWKKDSKKEALVFQVLQNINQQEGHEAYLSIRLGGYLVFGGNALGIKALLKELPKEEDYPFQLINHAAFHTPLLRQTSDRAFQALKQDLFHSPKIPLVDGRGKIWQTYSSEVSKLYDYTFNHQVVAPYDFSAAITVCLKEFMPDRIVLLGPGNSLGGSIGQIMIENDWKGIKTKADFSALQKSNPFLISMGIQEQAARLLPQSAIVPRR